MEALAFSVPDGILSAFGRAADRHGFVDRNAFNFLPDGDGGSMVRLMCDVLFPGGEALVPYQSFMDFLYGPMPQAPPIGASLSERWARMRLLEAKLRIRSLEDELVAVRDELLRTKAELNGATHARDVYFQHVPPGLLSRCYTRENMEGMSNNEKSGPLSYSPSCQRPATARPDACFGHIQLNLPEQAGQFDGIASGAGLLVMAPRISKEIVVCSLKPQSEKVTHINVTHIAGGGPAKFHGVAFDGEDLFACGPRGSDQLLLYSSSKHQVTGVDITSVATGANKYNGIAFGDGIFACVPYDADELLLYHRDTGRVQGVNITHVAEGPFKFNEIAYGDGLFVGAPRSSDRILCHDLASGQTWGIDVTHKVSGPDKCAGIAYGGGVFVLAPYNADTVLAYFPQTRELKDFDVTGVAVGPQKFAGCAYLGDDTFVCSPFHSDAILRFCPQSGKVESCSLPDKFRGMESKFSACTFGDGLVICSPFTPCELLLYSDAVHVRVESETQGVSLVYLLTEFRQQAKESSQLADPCFHELKDLVFGEKALGFGKQCPRDGKQDCALVDALPTTQRRKATHFLSWVWSYKLSVVLGALQSWLQRNGLDNDSVFIWMCYACNNQFRILGPDSQQQGSDNLQVVFESRLRTIGRMLALIDSWERPTYHQRIWTQFEQYTATKLGTPVTMILPPEEAASLQAQINSGLGLDSVVAALYEIDAERAQASVKADEIAVKKLIRDSVGFERLNEAVKRSMQDCVALEFKTLLQRKIKTRPSTSGLNGSNNEAKASPSSLMTHSRSSTRLRAALQAGTSSSSDGAAPPSPVAADAKP